MQDFFNKLPGKNTKLLEGDIVKLLSYKTINNVRHDACIYLSRAKCAGEPLINLDTFSELLGEEVIILGFFKYKDWEYLQICAKHDRAMRYLAPPMLIDVHYGIYRKGKHIIIRYAKIDALI